MSGIDSEKIASLAIALHSAGQEKKAIRREMRAFLRAYEKDAGKWFVYADASASDKEAYDAIYRRKKTARNATARKKVRLNAALAASTTAPQE